MSDPQTVPAAIVQATEAGDCYRAALAYQKLQISVIPLRGKHPALSTWSQYQTAPATAEEITQWRRDKLFGNVGIICGAVSNNLVVLDFDGPGGYPAFIATFPHLANTFVVATGGGTGRHLYLYAE